MAVAVGVTRLAACAKGVRKAIEKYVKERRRTSVERMYEKISRGQTADVNNVARVKALANESLLNAVMTIELADCGSRIEPKRREPHRRLAAADHARLLPRDTAPAQRVPLHCCLANG